MKIFPTTLELVTLLQNESKEVKSSTGGTKNFRSVIDFVTFNSSYQDNEKMKVIKRSKKEMAKLLENNFPPDKLNEVKNIYSKIVIADGMDSAVENFYNSKIK